MNYISSKEFALKWKISDRMVRNYCCEGKIPGAFIKGKTWYIPLDAKKPAKTNTKMFGDNNLLNVLREEKHINDTNGIYSITQTEFTYNSNRIEGSTLTLDDTVCIYDTNMLYPTDDRNYNVDDIIETVNHFCCIDYIIDNAMEPLSETMIKKIHFYLKYGTSDSRKSWFGVGEYKKISNVVGTQETCSPENVKEEMKKLIEKYNAIKSKTFKDILEFHVRFERIHPFQDGNGRVGRLIMFKECLANNIVPFIIEEENKNYYYRGLREWDNEKGYLLDTCLTCQDRYKHTLDYLKVKY